MINIPDFVFEYLIKNKYIGKTRTLFIGENYPAPNYKNYFYRDLPNNPHGVGNPNPPPLFTMLLSCLLVPYTNCQGQTLTPLKRLIYFLNKGFLLIDAQPNGVPPVLNPPVLAQQQLNNLIYTILLINPENIIFLTKNNQNVINQIKNHTEGNRIIPIIVNNPVNSGQVFAFPAPPANPHLFCNQVNALRANGFNI